MPRQASDPLDAGAVLADLETEVSRLRYAAQAQRLAGKPAEAAASHAEADKLETMLHLLRVTAEGTAARDRKALH